MGMDVPFYRHSLGEDEKRAISDSLDSEILTSGVICKSVEAKISEYFGIASCKLTNSWTNGMLAALMALEVGFGDEVIIPSMTFVACANVVELLGATPIFCDVENEDLLVSAEKISQKITQKTKAVMVVHLYGQLAEMREIASLCRDKGISIVEDAAHSFEASRNGVKPGQLSDFAVFSFYATKNLTTGEGGAVVTNDTKLRSKIEQLAHHGMSAGASDRFKDGRYSHWDVDKFGIKANMPDILASLLPNQLRNLEKNRLQREVIAIRYRNAFEKTQISIPKWHSSSTHSHHLFPIWVGNFRDQAINVLNENGIKCTVNFRAVHDLSYYSKKYASVQRFDSLETAMKWGKGVVSIPLFPSLTIKEQDYIIETILEKINPFLQESF